MEDLEFNEENITPEMMWLAFHLVEMRRLQNGFTRNPNYEAFVEKLKKETEIDKALAKIMAIAKLELVDG